MPDESILLIMVCGLPEASPNNTGRQHGLWRVYSMCSETLHAGEPASFFMAAVLWNISGDFGKNNLTGYTAHLGRNPGPAFREQGGHARGHRTK